MNNVIVHFPWGAGGNLIRNFITLDTRFEFLDDTDNPREYPTVQERYDWLLGYYEKHITSDTWLRREWDIRQKLYNRYYLGGIAYWNPNKLLAYDCHGNENEIKSITSGELLRAYDRYRIDQGLAPEQFSSWTLKECSHIFLLPEDPVQLNLINEIYNSKNPVVNQFHYLNTIEEKRAAIATANAEMNYNLHRLSAELVFENQSVQKYTTGNLYNGQGAKIIQQVISTLGLQIPFEFVQPIYDVWLQSTHEVYYNYFNRELKI